MSRTLRRVVVGTVAAACVITPAAALAGGKHDKGNGRFTGGGNFLAEAGGATVKATHGLALWCKTSHDPQQLQVNWSGGNGFHLTDLQDSFCTEEGYNQENPEAPIDTYYGEGYGKLNFGAGDKAVGYAKWRFVDDGEPGGGRDLIRIVIRRDGPAGEVLLTADTALTKGNHQAHRVTGSAARSTKRSARK